jgi:glutaminyl-peptide cyclotransferase
MVQHWRSQVIAVTQVNNNTTVPGVLVKLCRIALTNSLFVRINHVNSNFVFRSTIASCARRQAGFYSGYMDRIKCAGFTLAIAALAVVGAQAKTFSGTAALDYTRQAVELGPRPDGSPAIARLRALIEGDLGKTGAQVTTDAFTAMTPDGPVAMENIIAKFPGKSGKAMAVTGHYDTKKIPGFVGANDGGSSTGVLLELAASLAGQARVDDVYIVFFDGEEAVRQWTATDSVYGSRHLAEKWTADGTNARLKGLINVDMIGDRDLRLVYESQSAASLRKLVWEVAGSLGFGDAFPQSGGGAVDDDHVPFLNAGVRAVDLIDFDYGPNNAYWHTKEDTIDKLSARSLETIGIVVMKVIEELERQK